MTDRQPKIVAIVYERGEGPELDAILTKVAHDLRRAGVKIAGAVQHNTNDGDRCRCDMILEDLESGQLIEISEYRGPESRACRLDPRALEEVVGLAASTIENGVEILIVNKFGKREAEGRGFLPLIDAALEKGAAVLVAVNESNIDAWNAFASDFDERLEACEVSIKRWCNSSIAAQRIVSRKTAEVKS